MSASPTIRRLMWGVAVACAALALGGCRKKPQPDLVIVSPHNKKIEAEFEQAFRAWHKEKFGSDVKLEWRDVGGTTTTTKYLLNQYARSDSSGIDVYFGGGAPDHKLLTAHGVTQPVQLPEQTLAQLPETIGGIRQRDPAGHWHGAAVSCFGIFYNAKLLRKNELPIPKTWDDLAHPRMRGRIGAADASQSGSARAAYEMIVQSAPNWPAGWAKLLTIFANCKHFPAGASDVITDVANGEILAGAAIDFYAYDQIAVSGDDLGFALVAGTTAFTPDPISLLKGAAHAEMAQRFIRFVLSDQGQRLWCLPVGVPGGPATHALYRQPIRRDVYSKYAGKMLPPLVDPFAMSGSFRLDERAAGVRISRLYGPLMQAAAINSRTQLSGAWKHIIDAGRPAKLLEQFVALPTNLADEQTALATVEQLGDPRQREIITSQWVRFFRDKYERIIAEPGR